MTSFKKTLLALLVVAGVSSATSIALFSTLQDKSETTSINADTDPSAYATPTTFTPVVSRPAVETDFTRAAASTVNAVVSIKSTTMQQQRSSGSMEEELFRYFFGQGRRFRFGSAPLSPLFPVRGMRSPLALPVFREMRSLLLPPRITGGKEGKLTVQEAPPPARGGGQTI